jgi:hypothetical protein
MRRTGRGPGTATAADNVDELDSALSSVELAMREERIRYK